MSVYRSVYFEDDEICRKDMLDDLQLAAELGKTLLERNKELETSLKQHQNIIEDQTQEIEYLTKQTVALREVNDSRLRIYEQLEVSIHDLERANHRLSLDNAADKKQIKNLCASVDALEAKCEELQSTIDDLTLQLNTYRRKVQKKDDVKVADTGVKKGSETECVEQSHDKQIQCDTREEPEKCSSLVEADLCDNEDVESQQITQLMNQLREIRTLRANDHKRIVELEEQLETLIQTNQSLENQITLVTKEEEMKSMHEEFATLEEVRQGHLCARCLRSLDDLSILDPEEEEDDNLSLMDATISESRYRSSMSLDIQQDIKNDVPVKTSNCYRDLAEKYENLLAVNRDRKSANCMSLQEELQMSGDFNTMSTKDTDEESGHGDSYDKRKNRKAQTPTDFSEAETSSSGFVDETSNKSTQTDGRPGSFLCTIGDGEDCKFSIYDSGGQLPAPIYDMVSPLDCRFRNRPEYRELFKEIFTVLKKAAENKDRGEELPLLDDCVPKVPPVTPSTEQLPDMFADDNQSVVSAMSDTSVSVVEPPTVVENVPEKNAKEEKAEEKQKAPVLTPYKREPLEYISVSVKVRKKSASKKKKQLTDRSDSPVLSFTPKINFANDSGFNKKPRRDNKCNPAPNGTVWNGSTMQFWQSNRSETPSPTFSQNGKKAKNAWEFKPSTASQDLHKLKKLDQSYADVLRNADKKREALSKNVRRK